MYKMKKAPNLAPKNMLQNIIVANMVLAKTKKSGLSRGKSTLLFVAEVDGQMMFRL